jgi:calpain-15
MNERLKPIDYENIIKSNAGSYSDPYFRACKESIIDPFMNREKRIQNWSNFVWKRPKDVYGEGNYKVFNNISPDDIKQGHCGDCYYLSCLSSLAENPKWIKRIFLTQ